MYKTDGFYDPHEGIIELSTLPSNIIKVIKSADEEHRKTELNAQRALNETGFGKFNYKIVIVSGMIYMNAAFAIKSVGFILPSAACDFNMNTVDKSRLSASPIFGMLFGSCIWGCIADTKGRRIALLNCLFLQGVFDCLASVISSYSGFIVFKFLSGLALAGQVAVLYTYIGEFQPENYRDRAISCMEIAWVAGTMLAPCIAWITLPLEINLVISAFSFKSWNLYAVMCSLPAYIVGFLLLRLPETPKYLAEAARYDELRNVLTAMYRENSGNTTEEYIAKLNNAGITFFTDCSNDPTSNDTEKQENIFGVFLKFFVTLYRQTMMLLKPPYIGRTIITCLGSYCIFASFYALTLWFPELFHRFADFEKQHPGESANVCIVSQSATILSMKNESGTFANSSMSTKRVVLDDLGAESECNSSIETEVYVHTLILALSCIPAALIFSVSAARLGFRFYLILNSFGCSVVTIGLILVTNSTQNLVLSCIYESMMTICSTAIFCISVVLFPTNLRVTGTALASLFGRTGSLAGNTMFGYLIDDNCLVLISIVAIQLFLAAALGFFISNDNDGKSEKQKNTSSDVPKIGSTHSDNEQ